MDWTQCTKTKTFYNNVVWIKINVQLKYFTVMLLCELKSMYFNKNTLLTHYFILFTFLLFYALHWHTLPQAPKLFGPASGLPLVSSKKISLKLCSPHHKLRIHRCRDVSRKRVCSEWGLDVPAESTERCLRQPTGLYRYTGGALTHTHTHIHSGTSLSWGGGGGGGWLLCTNIKGP